MANSKKFSWDWDYESNALKVTLEFLDGKKATFGVTKENLESMSAAQFVKLLNSMQEAYPPYAGITVDGYAGPQPKKPSKLEKSAMFASLYGTVPASAYMKTLFGDKPKPKIKAIHVFDLGEGMLVPCELAHDVVGWLNAGKMHNLHFADEMIEDDLYGQAVAKSKSSEHSQQFISMLQAIGLDQYAEWFNADFDSSQGASKPMIVKASELTKQAVDNLKLQMYPGKIMIMDDMHNFSIDKDAWFLSNQAGSHFDWAAVEKGILDKIAKENVGKYAKPPMEDSPPPEVKILKNPKQITKATLEHFHKLLGGKKDPYLK